jgi:hypothetical protein
MANPSQVVEYQAVTDRIADALRQRYTLQDDPRPRPDWAGPDDD